MKVLVLGGTGNISTAVVRDLAGRGHDVTILTRGQRPAPVGIAAVVADRGDAAAMAAACGDAAFDAVVDFLCFTPEDAAVAHAAFAGRCAQYVCISSATVYAKPHRVPVREDDPTGNPASDYAQAKLATERWLMERHGDGFPVTVVRPSHTFGETWIPSPISGVDWTVAARILAGKPIVVHDDGRSLWALTPAADFAAALAGLLGNAAAPGEAVHITTDEVLSWNGIYQELGFALGAEPAIVHVPSDAIADKYPDLRPKLHGDKAHHGCFDNAKVKRLVPGWQCKTRLREALQASVDWFRAHPERQVVSAAANQVIEDLIAPR
jgi:nucleoside-diphosphate-sugar epimerase